MPLLLPVLRTKLDKVFNERLDSAQEIAQRIAKAYQEYAQGAIAPPGAKLIFKGTESKFLELALLLTVKARYLPPQAAQTIGNAVLQFWLTPPVLTSAGGAVTVVVPAAGVSTLLGVKVDTTSQAALKLAQAFDQMTRTVFVTNAPPLPSGTIF